MNYVQDYFPQNDFGEKRKITAESLIELIVGRLERPNSSLVQIRDYIVVGRCDLRNLPNKKWQINFTNCVFQEHAYITFCNYDALLLFQYCHFQGRLTMGDCIVGDFNLMNTIINSELEVGYNSIVEKFYVSSSKISSLKVNHTYINDLIIRSSEIHNVYVNFYTTFIEFLNLDSVFNTDVELKNNAIINKLTIRGPKERVRILIGNISLNELVFFDFVKQDRVEIINPIINSFSYKQEEKTLGDLIELKDLQVLCKENNFDLIPESYEKLCNISIKELKHKHFQKLGGHLIQKQLIYSRMPSTSSITIQNSELLNVHFKNVQFNNFEEINIIDSELSKAEFFNSLIPVDRVKGNPKALYETFNNLYSVASRRNNIRDKVDYYKSSQINLLRSISSKDEWYKKVPSIISLSFSYGYSNFGTRWTQAFFLMTPFLLFLTFSGMTLSSIYDVDFSRDGLIGFKGLLPYYLKSFNPAHDIKFMNEINPSLSNDWHFILFDLLSRIVVAIGIYETVRSFRKYSRS